MNQDLPLRDIQLPAPLGWWPPAPGWWVLAAAIPALLLLAIWLYRRLTRATALKAARQAVTVLAADTGLDAQQKLAALSMLFRRAAVSLFPRADVASLTGDAWLAFLQQSLPDTRFTAGAGRLLADAPYRRDPLDAETLQALFKLYHDWLRAAAKQQR